MWVTLLATSVLLARVARRARALRLPHRMHFVYPHCSAQQGMATWGQLLVYGRATQVYVYLYREVYMYIGFNVPQLPKPQLVSTLGQPSQGSTV